MAWFYDRTLYTKFYDDSFHEDSYKEIQLK